MYNKNSTLDIPRVGSSTDNGITDSILDICSFVLSIIDDINKLKKKKNKKHN